MGNRCSEVSEPNDSSVIRHMQTIREVHPEVVVRPSVVIAALKVLQQINNHYQDVEIEEPDR